MAPRLRGLRRDQSNALPSLADLLQVVVFSVRNGLLPMAGRGLLYERPHVLVSQLPCPALPDRDLLLFNIVALRKSPCERVCSPSGTKCVDALPTGWPSWGAVTTCMPDSQHLPVVAVQAAPVQGKCVCKPGPPLAASKTLKNVLVIGDSVSLGYTPILTKLMEKAALVQ